jgi:hypothetical protein
MNVLARASQENDGIRLECWTKTNARFTYLLTASSQKGGKCTRVHVGWDHGPEAEDGLNDPLVAEILDRVEAQSHPDRKLESRKVEDPVIARIVKLGGHVERKLGTPDQPVIVVDLHKTRAGDEDLTVLRNFPQLQRLNLYATNVTDSGLRNLQGLKSLQVLYLNDTEIGDAGLANLRELPALRELGLRNTRVTDRGLTSLQALPSLGLLILRGRGITDMGLEHLKGMKSLTTLQLSDTAVTEAGVADLQRALPKLKVIR